jgi:antitoxin component of MazEF toxin-antitoxin module
LHIRFEALSEVKDMITQQLRKSGNSYIVTIPKDEVDRLGLREGQMVALDVTPMEMKPVLRPELAKIVEEGRDVIGPVMRYLKDK